MKTISHIDLCSENFDFVSVIAKDIKFLFIRKISGSTVMGSDYQMETTLFADDISLALDNEALINKTHLGVSLYDLIHQRDFSQLAIHFTDGSMETYYFPWSKENDFVNKFQHDCFDEKDLVIINIKKENE